MNKKMRYRHFKDDICIRKQDKTGPLCFGYFIFVVVYAGKLMDNLLC